MKVFEIILVVFLGIFVLGVIIKSIIDKKQGKCSCNCSKENCSCCNKYKKK